jgi:hypothetical protein
MGGRQARAAPPAGLWRRWAVGILLGGASQAAAQIPVAAPGGVLTGAIRDSVTGQPVGYALVALVEREIRVFASQNGRFQIGGLREGPVTLRVTQIGYRGRSVPLVVDIRPDAPGTALTVAIERQPLVLPDLVTRSDECPAGSESGSGGESGTILDEVFRNAERMLAVQRAYPYRSSFQHVTTILNANREPQRRTVDTIEVRSLEIAGYERGKVLALRPSTEFGRAGLREHASYFQASDLARPDFRKNHCFWVAGPDSVRGFPAYRIEFRPRAEVRTTDWAGILQIDSASMHLLRSEAWLVNLPPTGTAFSAARCSALYTQLVPTLVLEFQVHCVAAQNVRPPAFSDDRWTLVARSFLGKRPDP